MQIYIMEVLLFFSNRLGATPTAALMLFQTTSPIPRYTTYTVKSCTLNTAPYTSAKAAIEILTSLRESDDALVKKTTESFIESLNILRTRTEGTDGAFVEARKKYFSI